MRKAEKHESFGSVYYYYYLITIKAICNINEDLAVMTSLDSAKAFTAGNSAMGRPSKGPHFSH